MGNEPVWVTNIRMLRTARGWSQGELSIRAGVQPNTLSAALNGKSSPNLSTLEKLCAPDVLNIPLWRLFVDDRQADVLLRQQAADEALARESEIASRIEQRVIEKLAGVVRSELAEEMTPKPAPPAIVKRHRKAGR
jgi:transcriptional regulator with XRE-family HTH domain